MASRLDITDTYLMTHRSVSIHRVTRYTDITTLYFFDQEGETEDHILGRGTHMTVFKGNQLLYDFVRKGDGALYHSIKMIPPSNPNQLSVIMNFTLGSGHVTCRQVYSRR